MMQSADPTHAGAAAALRREQRLRQIVEHAQDLIDCCDAQGRVTGVTRPFTPASRLRP
jgi:PAS domain-containing protein